MNRRDFLVGGAAVLGGSAMANPVRSILGSKGAIYAKEEHNDYTAADYVQDGLIAHYDGIENAGYGIHDSDKSKQIWKDLTVNGYDMTGYNGNPIVSINDDSYTLSCTKTVWMRWSQGMLSTKTVECVFQLDDMQKTVIFCPHSGYAYPFIVFSIANEGLMIPLQSTGNKSAKGIPISVGDINCVTVINTGTITSSGYLAGKKSEVLFTSSGEIGCGYNYSDFATMGFASSMNARVPLTVSNKIYTVRCYSRVLDATEIAYNYKIDKARFNLQ